MRARFLVLHPTALTRPAEPDPIRTNWDSKCETFLEAKVVSNLKLTRTRDSFQVRHGSPLHRDGLCFGARPHRGQECDPFIGHLNWHLSRQKINFYLCSFLYVNFKWACSLPPLPSPMLKDNFCSLCVKINTKSHHKGRVSIVLPTQRIDCSSNVQCARPPQFGSHSRPPRSWGGESRDLPALQVSPEVPSADSVRAGDMSRVLHLHAEEPFRGWQKVVERHRAFRKRKGLIVRNEFVFHKDNLLNMDLTRAICKFRQ